MLPCHIIKCTECDGTGRRCNTCQSASIYCDCDEEDIDLTDCLVCDACGVICTVHKAGSPTATGPCNGTVEVNSGGRS